MVNILHILYMTSYFFPCYFLFFKKKNLEKKYEERTGLTSPETVENYKGTKDVFSFSRWRVVAGLFHLNTLLIWLSSHSLSGDSKNFFPYFMDRLWKFCKYIIKLSFSLKSVFGTVLSLSHTHYFSCSVGNLAMSNFLRYQLN